MKNKKTALVISDFFYPHWTGVSKSIYNLTQALRKEVIFTVLTTRYSKNLKREEYINKTYVIRCEILFAFSRAKYSFSLIIKFLKLIKNYDIVLINSPFTNILPVSLITKLFGKKLLIFHQGDLILPEGLSNRIIERIFDISTYISFMLADKIATYTKDYADNSRVMKPFLKKTIPLLLPVILSRKQHKNHIDKSLTDLKTKQKILFGFGGRFVEEKGFDILFEAIPKVIKQVPQAHFVFAGEIFMGYEYFYEKNQVAYNRVKKYITVLGLLNEQQLVSFYKNIDFIVIPSRSDCFNMVQAEAMLWEKPSIVSNIPGARFLVQKTGFGLLCKPKDPQDLAEKIIRITSLRDKLMKKRYLVKEFLDPYATAQKIKKYLEF